MGLGGGVCNIELYTVHRTFFCLYKLLLVPNRINFGYMHYTSGTYRWQESVSFAEDCFVLPTAKETIVLPTKKKRKSNFMMMAFTDKSTYQSLLEESDEEESSRAERRQQQQKQRARRISGTTIAFCLQTLLFLVIIVVGYQWTQQQVHRAKRLCGQIIYCQFTSPKICCDGRLKSWF